MTEAKEENDGLKTALWLKQGWKILKSHSKL